MEPESLGGRPKQSYRYRLILERSDQDRPWQLVERITLGEFQGAQPGGERRSGTIGGYLAVVSRWLSQRESGQD